MNDGIRIEEDHGQRLLSTRGKPEGYFRVRILTEEAMTKLSDDDFRNYLLRVRRLQRQASANPNLRNADTIKAWDYLKNAVWREVDRRKKT